MLREPRRSPAPGSGPCPSLGSGGVPRPDRIPGPPPGAAHAGSPPGGTGEPRLCRRARGSGAGAKGLRAARPARPSPPPPSLAVPGCSRLFPAVYLAAPAGGRADITAAPPPPSLSPSLPPPAEPRPPRGRRCRQRSGESERPRRPPSPRAHGGSGPRPPGSAPRPLRPQPLAPAPRPWPWHTWCPGAAACPPTWLPRRSRVLAGGHHAAAPRRRYPLPPGCARPAPARPVTSASPAGPGARGHRGPQPATQVLTPPGVARSSSPRRSCSVDAFLVHLGREPKYAA
ncbi:basic proline-rich protein-like [Corvus moneduloides]|uniref:basic proline-rich protein-like n=1 Tax=Corvus moneduloides TaxID=1196302 RepID=UPI001363EB45|nr:basic proline-rich protein-like [Corvus moneduloides]